MKIKYKEAAIKSMTVRNGRIVLEFNIVDSILKTHFKALMGISNCYDSREKKGFIGEKKVEEFKSLIEKIEKSDIKKARASHAKTAEKAKQRHERSGCEHEDLGSLGYTHGATVKCPHCGAMAQVW